MWPDHPFPVIFAHRGASAHAPENTLAAFELAAQQGADAIELDAKLSADGQVVVIHDTTVDRTTDGHGRVADLPLAALRELDAGSFFSQTFRGERIPTLDEVFAAVGKKVLINVELTNYKTPRDRLVGKVVELVERHALQARVIFSSFFPKNLSQAARLLPETPRGLLALPGVLGWWSRSFGFTFGAYQALHPHLSNVTPQQVGRVHRLGRRIHVWTVNAADDMRRLKSWGVDGIFTDDPQLALQALGRAE
ncbi:MAG: glycerophosphodiester phosphodiesterase [Chloroflexi bacterium]|nr:glycerophosphodiester phosphodiesterase [Chloroflexota bacterium]